MKLSRRIVKVTRNLDNRQRESKRESSRNPCRRHRRFIDQCQSIRWM